MTHNVVAAWRRWRLTSVRTGDTLSILH